MDFEGYFSRLLVAFTVLGQFVETEAKQSYKSSKRKEQKDENWWCFHCASARNTQQDSMLSAMDRLLQIRGTRYPYNAVHHDCTKPYNITGMQRKTCKYPWCFAVTFDDHIGVPLTIRGCAENLLAMTEETRSGCQKMHPTLDITDCVCPVGDRMCVSRSRAPSLLAPRAAFVVLLIIFVAVFDLIY